MMLFAENFPSEQSHLRSVDDQAKLWHHPDDPVQAGIDYQVSDGPQAGKPNYVTPQSSLQAYPWPGPSEIFT